MEIDYLVMLTILRLHKGKSILLLDGSLSDVAGINDITVNDVLHSLLHEFNINVNIKNLDDSIIGLVSMGHLNTKDGRLCPSLGLIHYFVEILQYEKDLYKSLRMLKRRMEIAST